MNIVYHASDSFAKVTGTSIVSIFENNKDIDEINVYVIEKNFTEDNKKKMEQLADKYNRRIIFMGYCFFVLCVLFMEGSQYVPLVFLVLSVNCWFGNLYNQANDMTGVLRK